MLADPVRNRFYVLRQDKNQVLVYDGAGLPLLATLRTGNTPTQMAFTFDRRYLLVGNDNSQIANVYDLETLEATDADPFPGRPLPALAGGLGTGHSGGVPRRRPDHTIDRVDFYMRDRRGVAHAGRVREQDRREHGAGRSRQRRLHHGGGGRRQPAALQRHRRHLHHLAQGLRVSGGRLRRLQLRPVRGGQPAAQLLAGADCPIRERNRDDLRLRLLPIRRASSARSLRRRVRGLSSASTLARECHAGRAHGGGAAAPAGRMRPSRARLWRCSRAAVPWYR